MSDTEYILKCRKQIEEKLNWLDIDNLKQRDFQYLGDAIYEKTKTQLSLSTIKRIWDSSYNKSFQINTLDALAQYLDYQSWHHFKEQNFELINSKSNNKPTEDNLPKNRTKKKRSLKIKLGLLLSIIVMIVTLLLLFKLKDKTIQTEITSDEIFLTSKKSVKEGVPNTIIFNYDIGSYKPDSLCIQLSWNPKERENINENDHFYTCTYYFPGYHYAKLVVDNDVIKGHSVHITTKDWLTLVRETPEDITPTYIRNSDVISNGNMFASPYLLKLNNVDLTLPEFYVSYFNIKDFEGLDSDNFSFETEIKNSSEDLALICQNCFIFIYGDSGTIGLPICTEGCVSDIDIFAGDARISGKTNDLSGLGCDLTDWSKVRGEIKNKDFKIFIDDNLAYELTYNKSIGNIKGWHYFFKGAGAVNYLNISDSANNIVYKDEFWR